MAKKLYGFTQEDIQTGDLRSAPLEWHRRTWASDALAGHLGWEECHSTFANAKAALIRRMEEAGQDYDLIVSVKKLKAADVPVMG